MGIAGNFWTTCGKACRERWLRDVGGSRCQVAGRRKSLVDVAAFHQLVFKRRRAHAHVHSYLTTLRFSMHSISQTAVEKEVLYANAA